MFARRFSVLFRCALLAVVFARTGSAQVSTPDRSNSNQIPVRYSLPQYLPCHDQTKSFGGLFNSFTSGHLPSRSEITGSWVLTGFWLHRESHPDLNCHDIMRGQIFEWVILAQDYSLGIDMAGTYSGSAFEARGKKDLTFTVDLGGEASPIMRCRLTQRETLVCLGSTYYSGLEFRRIQARCEPPPSSQPLDRRTGTVLCFPSREAFVGAPQ
jgi:hypothetical protein